MHLIAVTTPSWHPLKVLDCCSHAVYSRGGEGGCCACHRTVQCRPWHRRARGRGGGGHRLGAAADGGGRAAGRSGQGKQGPGALGLEEFRLRVPAAQDHHQPGAGRHQEGRVGVRLADRPRPPGGQREAAAAEAARVLDPGRAVAGRAREGDPGRLADCSGGATKRVCAGFCCRRTTRRKRRW